MIRVNKDYVIDNDTLCYTAKLDNHKQTIKKNKISGVETVVDTYTVVGYYHSIEGAIKGVIEDMIKRELSEGVYELKEALSIIKEYNDKFETILREVTEAN